MVLSWFGSDYPQDQALQHIPTVLGLLLLALAHRRRWLSVTSFLCITVFIWLHILGARWVYSNVPYDQWLTDSFGFSPREYFGWHRNHYDRLVHFSFGLLFLFPITEVCQQAGGLSRRLALSFALLGLTAVGAVYEIIEWIVAECMSPEHAESYNGQQGDFFDAQKDLGLALLGSILGAIVPLVRRPNNR
ncbi:MAG: putative membrane protein [Planctomycetota bacterium]|jgi:putative membrane protein